MTGAADPKKPGGAVNPGGGPLPDDDASSPGVEAFRDRVRDRQEDADERITPS